jgi:hypothetical protein
VGADELEALAGRVGAGLEPGVERPLARANLSATQRVRLREVFDPVPTSLRLSMYADARRRTSHVGFYVIVLEAEEEIGHTEHSTLDAALDHALERYGVPHDGWEGPL